MPKKKDKPGIAAAAVTAEPAPLEQIESQLETILKAETDSFVKIYELLDTVEKNNLYEKHGYKSFTAYVNSLAKKTGVHVSLIWARKRAGKEFADYKERLTERPDDEKPDLNKAAIIAPESVILCSQIAGNDAARMDALMDKVVQGDLKRQDLRNMRAAIREERQERRDQQEHVEPAEQAAGTPDALKPETATDDADKAPPAAAERMSAAGILMALQRHDWLAELARKAHTPQVEYFGTRKKWNRQKYIDEIYTVLPEFPVRSGTTRSARRVDAMIFESLTVEDPKADVCIRGIEIKVSKHDLLTDDKMAEYTEYCDFFYIAVPDDAEMIEAAESYRLPEWGIIVCRDGHARIHAPAGRLRPVCRDKALTSAILKLGTKARL